MEKFWNKKLTLINENITNNMKAIYTLALSLNNNIIDRNNLLNDKKQLTNTEVNNEIKQDIDANYREMMSFIDVITDYYATSKLDKHVKINKSNKLDVLDKLDNNESDDLFNVELDNVLDNELDNVLDNDVDLELLTNNFMSQQEDLSTLMSEKRKQLKDPNVFIPKKEIKFYLDTKAPITEPERTDNVNVCDFDGGIQTNGAQPSTVQPNGAQPSNEVRKHKPIPPINALTRISIAEREELEYKFYQTAVNNIKKNYPNTPQEEMEKLIFTEADRLLTLYIETH